MGRSSVAWVEYEVNDCSFNPENDKIPLENKNQLESAKILEEKYPELFACLFDHNDGSLRLKIPQRGALQSDQISDQQLPLAIFLDANHGDGNYPIALTRSEQYPIDSYDLFARILSGYEMEDEDEQFGFISFSFDDLRGYVVSDGETEWDASLMIDKNGVNWDVG